MKLLLNKPDTLGAVASSFCMIHCMATPLLFVVHSCAIGGCTGAPSWWKAIDYMFLVISFFAVLRTTKTTSNKYMKPALWLAWLALLFVIMNELYLWVSLPEYSIYIPGMALVFLHVYNLKYCQCATDECCTTNQ